MIKAIKNKIFIKRDMPIEKIGSIYVPSNADSLNNQYSGVIVSIGSNIADNDLNVGDRILFKDLAGMEFYVNNEAFYSISDTDILAIILDKNIKIS